MSEAELHDEMDDLCVNPDGNLFDAVQDQFGSAPWWVVSVLFHSAVLVAALFFVLAKATAPEPPKTVVVAVPPKELPPEPPEKRKRDIIERPRDVNLPEEVEVEQPFIPNEDLPVSDRMETENDMDMQSSKGQLDAISDLPMDSTGFSGNLGIGGGAAGCFGRPTGGGRVARALQAGGGPATESAVDAALEWLARNQEADGSWLSQKHGGGMSDDVATGLTGLALLAFLGAGHTETAGKYRENVSNGVKWLISQQAADGGVGPNRNHKCGGGYNHAIAGLALAEAYGMGRLPSTKAAAQKAIDYTADVHQKQYKGWRYSPNSNGDLSVSGWFIMQLKSAKVAGLDIPTESIDGALNFLDTVEDKGEQHGGYEGGFFKYMPSKDHWSNNWTKSRICSIGMLGRLFLGFPPSDMMGGTELLSENVPTWDKPMFYYWYYATLVMFQASGEHWQVWNEAMKKTLLDNQVNRPGDPDDGSWDPEGSYGKRSGRVFSTALGALCLEVYYRYLPMYSQDG